MTQVPIKSRSIAAEAYCPHCFLLVEAGARPPWPPRPTRCPHCRLMIGPGRGRPTPEAVPGARGTAAGVFAHRARRDEDARPELGPETPSACAVREAIRSVAASLGCRPERLLMVDYQQQAASDPSVPDLNQVFASYGSWKRARREAAAG